MYIPSYPHINTHTHTHTHTHTQDRHTYSLMCTHTHMHAHITYKSALVRGITGYCLNSQMLTFIGLSDYCPINYYSLTFNTLLKFVNNSVPPSINLEQC